MKWCIVGHGALASLWAHHLVAAGESVTIITRPLGHAAHADKHNPAAGVGQAKPDVNHRPAAGETCPTNNATAGHAAHADNHNLTAGETCPTVFTLQHGDDLHTRDIATIAWPQLGHEHLHWSHILIMVKAWQLEGVIAELANHLQRSDAKPTAIILSHNGLGAAEKVLQAQADWPLYDLVTTHGAWRKTPYHVVHAGSGQSYIGPRQQPQAAGCDSPPVWFPALANALPPTSWAADILIRRWHKLAINCAINPLASIAGETNGVLKDPRYRGEIEAICGEISRLADIVLGRGVLDTEDLVAKVYQVIEATAENTCSMLQDMQNGHGTEIEYLNGYIVRLGAEFGIPTPVNQRMAEALA